jgi:hypothetical protein
MDIFIVPLTFNKKPKQTTDHPYVIWGDRLSHISRESRM